MAAAGTERLLRQAREVRDEELGQFCARASALLRTEEPGPEAVDALRRLFLIVAATKYGRKLEDECVDLLQTTLCPPPRLEPLQLLCAAILRETAPRPGLSLSCDRVQSPRQLSLAASVLLAQGDRKQVRSVGQRVFQVLESRQPEGPSVRPLLPVVSKVASLAPGSFHEDQANLLSKRLADWLRYASVPQGPAPSGGFFTPRARQPGPVTEVDGAVATDFFTVLSTAQRPTEDQWLNVQAFSMLRAWLQLGGPGGPGAPDTGGPGHGRASWAAADPGAGARCPLGLAPERLGPSDDRSEQEGSSLSVLSAAASTGRLPPPERLREKAFQYCQRLVEQSTRRALRRADADLQKACLVEAVLVLDVLCRQDPSFLYRTLSCLKALQARLSGDPACVRALLPLAQFFLSHGEAAAVDAEAVCRHVFGRLPAEHFHSPMLAFELVQFCRDSLPLLGRHLGLLRRSFPGLLKLLAWNSPPLTAEFVALLPALVDAGTAVELLHALLDLPCLTAALDLQLRLSPAASERPLWDASLRTASCPDASQDPQLQGLLQHLLRAEASGAPERLAPLYPLLQPMAGCARVRQCAEAVPTLLRAFFSAVTQFADGALTNQLARLLLERSDSLYPVPGYEARVHQVLSAQFLGLCQRRPCLVVELAKELLALVGSGGGLRSGGSVLTSVVWAVGEYLAVSWDRRCTVDQINKFFEVLEALLFEVTQSRPSATLPQCPPQLVTALMTTLTKLASRSQDLIPRVSLFLSKMRTPAQSPATGALCCREDEGVGTRATELLNLLKMPSVAQFVLTPGVEVAAPRYHRDTNTALPLALRAVSRLVEREAGLLPAEGRPPG